uniref:Uncharacterized protein n=1 Tax=Strongyloides stercoralis TaxID=6248 RepID=A0A0K0ENA4_STRER
MNFTKFHSFGKIYVEVFTPEGYIILVKRKAKLFYEIQMNEKIICIQHNEMQGFVFRIKKCYYSYGVEDGLFCFKFISSYSAIKENIISLKFSCSKDYGWIKKFF